VQGSQLYGVRCPPGGKETGRRHYREAISHLRELNKLDLSDRLKELVEELKRENDNRPAFLDEISSFTVI